MTQTIFKYQERSFLCEGTIAENIAPAVCSPGLTYTSQLRYLKTVSWLEKLKGEKIKPYRFLVWRSHRQILVGSGECWKESTKKSPGNSK